MSIGIVGQDDLIPREYIHFGRVFVYENEADQKMGRNPLFSFVVHIDDIDTSRVKSVGHGRMTYTTKNGEVKYIT